MDHSLYSNPGFVGGLAGAFLGLIGGILGTWFSYRNANSKKERGWIIFYASAIFIFCVAYLCLLAATSEATKTIIQIIYPFLLILVILRVTRHLHRLHGNTTDERS